MELLQKVLQMVANGEPVAVCTIVRSQGSTPRTAGSKMLVFEDGTIEGSVGGGELESRVIEVAEKALKDGKPQNLSYNMSDPTRGDPGVCGGSLEIFVEAIFPDPTIVVVGGGHVGKAVVQLAKWLGYNVVLTDDRKEFCSPESVPGADFYYPCMLSEFPKQHKINRFTYLLLTTRNVMVDFEGLPALLETQAAFIGIIGSRRRWGTTRTKLFEAGVSEDKLSRITSPMGLELSAETPEEIALSILSEIVMLRRGGDGARMGIDSP